MNDQDNSHIQIKLYSSRIIQAYSEYIAVNYPAVNIKEILDAAGINGYELEDHGHWFSQDEVDSFYFKVQEVINDKTIARKAGHFMASPKGGGEVRYYFLGLMGLANAYKMATKASKNLTRSSNYEVNILSNNSVEVITTFLPGIHEKEYQCQNRIGMFEAVAELYNTTSLKIDHPECVFKGHERCRYVITWGKSTANFVRRLMHFTAPVFIAGIMGVWFGSKNIQYSLFAFLGTSVFMLLLKNLSLRIEKNEVKEILKSTNRSPEKWIEQIELNYNNTLLNYEIGQIISNQTNISDVLNSVVHVSEKRLAYDRGAIFLADKDGVFLEFKAGFGYFERDKVLLEKTRFHLKNPDSRGIFVVSFREKRPFLINDVNNIEENLSQRSLEFAKQLGSQSFICCPIMYENKSLGIIVADNIRSKRKLYQSDLSLYMGIASAVGMALKTAELFEDKEKQFQSTLRILASSIDARDPLTAGHSEKVTEYAVAICGLLDLDSDTTEMIRLAALFHDYGKIAIPDAILKKEGPLSNDEYLSIQSHAVKTREILEEISFEGIYRDVPLIAGAHHEKMDGSGYPGRLKGEKIPLGSRIIAVADYFEALTAKRHYRDPMIVKEAIVELRKASGHHLDKEIVDIFIPYIQSALGLEHEKIVSA